MDQDDISCVVEQVENVEQVEQVELVANYETMKHHSLTLLLHIVEYLNR
jgi:hypothetical protein